MRVPVPRHLVLIAWLTGSLTAVLSIVYVVLCIIALLYRNKCEVGNPELTLGSDYFFNVLYRHYIQKDECEYAERWEELTQAHSVFVMISVTLAISFTSLVASISLITVMKTSSSRYLTLIIYVYVGVYTASLVIDVTLATHFGIDYATISNQLDASNAGLAMNYLRDTIRLVAFFLMTVVLKGFVAHAINIALCALMIYYLVQFTAKTNEPQHSIHKLGTLDGYRTSIFSPPKKKRDDSQSSVNGDIFVNNSLSSQVNPVFNVNDETSSASAMRGHTDFLSSRMYERSESWQAGPAGARPFSYLQEARRAQPARALIDARRAELVAPPLAVPAPAPDYSPFNRRRLNTAYI